MKCFGILAVLGVLLVGCGNSVSAPDNADATSAILTTEENDFLKLLNAFRRENGLSSLSISPTLQAAAAHHSLYMSQKSSLTHSEPSPNTNSAARISNSGGEFSSTAENIAVIDGGASSAFDLWYGSDGHRENMLSDQYQYIGVSRNGPYWTTDFGGI